MSADHFIDLTSVSLVQARSRFPSYFLVTHLTQYSVDNTYILKPLSSEANQTAWGPLQANGADTTTPLRTAEIVRIMTTAEIDCSVTKPNNEKCSQANVSQIQE
jgi:hypothetical protein